MKKKSIAMTLSIIMVLAMVIGGTLAWLQDAKQDTQTFTGGDHVRITSVSHSTISDAKVIPGKTVTFDPTIVVNNSVDAYVFVEFDEGASYLTLDSSTLAGWTALDGAENVYYREISAMDGATENRVEVFSNGTVTFSSLLTNDTIPQEPVTISVRAYAIQKDYVGDVNAAWAAVTAL